MRIDNRPRSLCQGWRNFGNETTRKPSSSTSLKSLQAARGLSACAVLLFHTTRTLELRKYLGRSVFPLFGAGNSGVQFFFVLSGFVIYLAHERDLGNVGALGNFLLKRFKRMYPPLWVVLITITPIYLFFPFLGSGHDVTPMTILQAFTIVPATREYLLAVEWTLRHEVLFYALFAIAIWNRTGGLILGIVWMSLSLAIPLFHAQPWSQSFFMVNHLLFGFGITACVATKHWKYSLPGIRLALSCLALGLFLFGLTWLRVCGEVMPNEEIATLLYGLAASLIISGLVVLERMKLLRVMRPLVFLGEASYSLYLVQYIVVSIATKTALLISSRYIVIPDDLIFILVASAGFSGGIAFHLFVEKPLLVFINSVSTSRKYRKGLPATS